MAAADARAKRPLMTRTRLPDVNLRAAWETNADEFAAWARAPMHDSYWRFHRDQFLELLPPPHGLTLDVGCGEGRLARDLRASGYSVAAFDSSPTMVDEALRFDPATTAMVADVARLPLRAGAADLAVAFMSLQDVDDLPGALRELGRVVEEGGYLCLAIVHPLNSAGMFADDTPDSSFVIEGSYLERSYYEDRVERNGLSVTFVSEHRPLEVYFEALAGGGFVVECLREPSVPEAAVRSPRDRRWQRLPLFLHIRARRVC
jgi:SAM-dependent methyltransferase